MHITTIYQMSGQRVVVPPFNDTGAGYMSVDRSLMSDDEWKTWMAISKAGEIARKMKEFQKMGVTGVKLAFSLVDFLNERGIQACLSTDQR